MIPTTNEAYKLLHNGSIALSQIEANGMKIDVDYLKSTITSTEKKIKRATRKLEKDKLYKTWRKKYGKETNLGSRQQLGVVLFEIEKYPCTSFTPTGRPCADATSLSEIDLPFVRNLLKVEKLKKANSTYLGGILQESTAGYLHPFFNLHLAMTYRSSSSNPNFQNIPIRDPEMAELIRRAFIARKNHRIVEADYGGVEIAGAACYHKDPVMISYIEDKTKDLHRDMAGQCFKLKRKQITKDIRYCGKNMYVFPEFYGDYYLHCAQNLWEAIGKMKLQTADGTPLKEHLKSQGIRRLGNCDPKERPLKGTFEKHLKEVEDDFWNKRFKVYGKWKKDWYNEYLKNGFFITLTGFRIEGSMKRNEVINYPVQGTAFHWLLWSIIRIQKQLKKYNMRTLLVGQIHDSLVVEIKDEQLDTVIPIVVDTMSNAVRLRCATPVEVEIGKCLGDMKLWVPKEV